jgi:hypothetical protein
MFPLFLSNETWARFLMDDQYIKSLFIMSSIVKISGVSCRWVFLVLDFFVYIKGAVIWNPATSYDEMTSFRNSSVLCSNGQYFLAHMSYFLAHMSYFKF